MRQWKGIDYSVIPEANNPICSDAIIHPMRRCTNYFSYGPVWDYIKNHASFPWNEIDTRTSHSIINMISITSILSIE